jgi:hypothetical protein
VRLDDGTTRPFGWEQVEHADESLRHGRAGCAIVDGRSVKVGDAVTFDPHDAHRPVRITEGAPA